MIAPALDAFDRNILRVLQENGRITNLELADRVNLSSAACLRRVRALEQTGVIRKYVALVEPASLGLSLDILIEVRLKAQTRELLESFEKRIASMPEILECCLVVGEWDYVLRVLAPDLDWYRTFQVDRLIGKDSEIALVKSTVVVKKIKSTTSLTVHNLAL